MRYFCLANPIALIKTTPSGRCLDNLPLFGTSMYGKLPITEAKIRDAFDDAEYLILCKTMDDALILRQTKLDKKFNSHPDFFNKINNLPPEDYVIYEVEIKNDIKVNFKDLTNLSKNLLASLVSYQLYFKSIYNPYDLGLPNVELCYEKKDLLKPRLIRYHYFPLDGVKEDEGTNCTLF